MHNIKFQLMGKSSYQIGLGFWSNLTPDMGFLLLPCAVVSLVHACGVPVGSVHGEPMFHFLREEGGFLFVCFFLYGRAI